MDLLAVLRMRYGNAEDEEVEEDRRTAAGLSETKGGR